MQGTNRRVEQDSDRWLLHELQGRGIDFADREESILLPVSFHKGAKIPGLEGWKNWRPRGHS